MGNVAPASTVAGGAANFYGAGSQGSGDKFPSLLPLAIQVAARTVGFDIVPVVPMNGPSGVLTYLDYVYAGGRDPLAPGLNNQASLGGTANAANTVKFGDKFQVFKMNLAAMNGVFDTTAEWRRIASGTYFIFSTEDPADDASALALLVQFVGVSRIDGFPIFRNLGEFNGTLTHSANNTFSDISTGQTQSIPYYQVIGAAGFLTQVTGSVTGGNGANWTVAVPAAATEAVDAGYYAELVRALEDHIQGFAGSGPLDDQNFSGNSTDGRSAYEQ